MGTTPKVNKKPKYNKDDKFRWVDSQWEKFMTEQKELKAKIQELELRVREADNLNEDLEEENSMLRNFVPPDDFHMGDEEFSQIVDEYKHKYKKKYKKLKSKYKEVKKQLKDLVKRTPSKFLSKDSDYSKPNWTPKQIAHWDKMIKESIKQTKKSWKKHKVDNHKIEWKDEERSDEWRIEQFNRNRAIEDQVRTIEELDDKVSEIFSNIKPKNKTKYIYESPDGGKTLYRREFGKSDKENISG